MLAMLAKFACESRFGFYFVYNLINNNINNINYNNKIHKVCYLRLGCVVENKYI